MRTCTSCGSENPFEQKFCGECGAGLAAPGETRRRLVTALFMSSRDGNGEIYGANTDGSGLINLTNNPGGAMTRVWSPAL